MELRLCSIEGGLWLDSLNPKSMPVKSPPKGLGLMFGRAIESRIRAAANIADLLTSPVEGFVLAFQGIAFEEQLLISSAHAIGCAAIASKTRHADNANILEAFIRGDQSFSDIPMCLKMSGVVSCISSDDARRIGDWIEAVDRSVLVAEIGDMHGSDAINAYLSVIDDLKSMLRTATRIHGCDIASWRNPIQNT